MPFITLLTLCLISTFRLFGNEEEMLSAAPEKIVLNPKIDDNTISFVGTIRNTSNQTVRISSISSSCPCTSVSCDELVVSPGGKVTYSGSYVLGLQKGTVNETLFISILHFSKRMEIKLEVHMPTEPELLPGIARWKINEKLTERSIQVIIPPEYSLHLIAAHSLTDVFHAQWIPGDQDHLPMVIITPITTKNCISTAVEIITDGKRVIPIPIFITDH